MEFTTRAAWSQRGAAGVIAILFLPVLLAALASLAGLGDALLLRHRVGQAADFGALAAIQCLDYERLAQGVIQISEGQAASSARQYVQANLGPGEDHPGGVNIEVEVFNPDETARRDSVTGKRHEYATVCVRVTLGHEFRLGPLRLAYSVFGHADASAVPR